MIAPCGKYTNASLGLGLPAVCASTVPAGIIASSSGSATVAPRPRSIVRRDRCFLVTNIVALLSLGGGGLRRDRLVLVGGWRRAELERLAVRDAGENRREAVVLAARVVQDAPHRRHVVVLHAAAERVNHELLGQRLHELGRIVEQRFPQIDGPLDRPAIGELTRRVDRDAGLAVLVPPCADRIEVLERE